MTVHKNRSRHLRQRPATEGLSTAVVDALAASGQASTTSRIENYLGFPGGVSGTEFGERAQLQAQLLGSAVIIATGVDYRALDVAGIERFEGLGVFYSPLEADRVERRAAGSGECANRRGTVAAAARALGLHSVTGAPVIVDGVVWGLMTIASADGPIPDHALDRLAECTELLGTAIANTQSRAELSASRARIVTAAARPGGGSSVTCTTVFSSASSGSG